MGANAGGDGGEPAPRSPHGVDGRDPSLYHLMLDSMAVDLDTCVDLIVADDAAGRCGHLTHWLISPQTSADWSRLGIFARDASLRGTGRTS